MKVHINKSSLPLRRWGKLLDTVKSTIKTTRISCIGIQVHGYIAVLDFLLETNLDKAIKSFLCGLKGAADTASNYQSSLLL